MHRAAFQLNKVRRLIRTQGKTFTVLEIRKDGFGEPNGTTESFEIKGVYHETTSYISKTAAEASTTVKKSCPMVLALWEEVGSKLSSQTFLLHNDRIYKVNAVKNLEEANLVADISLEEVEKSRWQAEFGLTFPVC